MTVQTMFEQSPFVPTISAELFAANAERIRTHLAALAFRQLVGAELDNLEPGGCVVSVRHRPELLQQHGLFHGGVTAFLVDHATTLAATTLLAPGRAALTAQYNINLLAPGRGERLICRARVVRPGTNLTVVAADVFSSAAGREKHTATALATIAIVDRAALEAAAPKQSEASA